MLLLVITYVHLNSHCLYFELSSHCNYGALGRYRLREKHLNTDYT